jgi:hypothetical protein
MAMKPKKIMNVNRPESLGGGAGSSRLSNTFGRAPKVEAKKPPKKVATSPNSPIKIKSGGDIKPAFPKKVKPKSYNELKDMPNLIKIDSAKGNKIKKIAYRRRSSN